MTIAQKEVLKVLCRKIRHEALMVRTLAPNLRPIPWLENQLEEFGEFFGRIMDAESAKVAESLLASFDTMSDRPQTMNSCRRWMDLASGILRVLVEVEKEKAKHESTETA